MWISLESVTIRFVSGMVNIAKMTTMPLVSVLSTLSTINVNHVKTVSPSASNCVSFLMSHFYVVFMQLLIASYSREIVWPPFEKSEYYKTAQLQTSPRPSLPWRLKDLELQRLTWHLSEAWLSGLEREKEMETFWPDLDNKLVQNKSSPPG